jgi:hypothetical protein
MKQNEDNRPTALLRPRDRATGIRVLRGHKFSHVVMFDGGIKVVKLLNDVVYRDWSVLHIYREGRPDPEKVYKVQDAARRFLNWGKTAGITESAERALKEILSREGTMNQNAKEVTKANEPKPGPTPSAASVKDAAKKTAEKATTKNGTTAAAKKPGKVAVPKPEKATAKTKPEGKNAGGRPGLLAPEKKIKVLVKENPRREGTQVAINFANVVMKHNGKSVAAYLAAGGRGDMLVDDIRRKYVELV